MGYEKRQFLYGMDFDTEERLVAPGFSRKNVNVRIGTSTDAGVLSAENIQGNTFIPNVDLPTGENKVIGSYWNKLRDLSYYFVYNDLGDHGIFEYNHVEGKIKTVMIAKVLNFQSDQLVTGVNVVEFDKDNHLLYFTDGFNPPRKINIEKSKSGLYSTPIKEEIIDAIKYPPLFPPTAIYKTSGSSVNYFNEYIWQFKAAYVYDDKEVSAFSPISVQILPDTNCLDNDSQSNTIRITIPKGGELVERVIVAGREGNLNDFLELIDQDVDDYEVDVDGNYVYVFVNDGVYNAVSVPQSNKLFDNLPQIAQAQEYIEGNRISYGNITEGYDNVDVDLDVSLQLDEIPEESLNTVKGYLRISNGTNSASDFRNFQPIHSSNGTAANTTFGGFSTAVLYNPTSSLFRTAYRQQLPLQGFVIYLAGTDFYNISKQINVGGDGAAIQTGDYNVFNSSSTSNRKQIREDIKGSAQGFYNQSRTWSTWQIKDVPDGDYIIRVASNLTTSADLLDPERGYQSTSTYVQRIGFNATTGVTQNPQKELKVTVQGGQILDDIEIVISDLTPPEIGLGESFAVSGYLVNPSDLSYTPTDIPSALGQKRVTSARIEYDNSLFGLTPDDNNFIDHNGFFYTFSRDQFRIDNILVGLYSEGSIPGYDLLSPTGTSVPFTTTYFPKGNSLGVFLIRNSDIFNYSKATVLIKFLDAQGQGIKNIKVISSRGDSDLTDSLGQANISVYSESGQINTKRDFLYYPNKSTCKVSFDPSSIFQTFQIGINNDNDLGDEIILPDVTVTFLDSSGKASLKKGGVYSFGLVYYDRANRSGTTNNGDKLTIPFYTEQFNGSLVEDGLASFKWSINNLPPSWATHYQIVRTKNTSLNSYIQWATDKVAYKTSSGVDSTYSDGSIVELDITNLTDEYKTANPSSVLVYGFTSRDRIRFIKDFNGNFFDEYHDLKVLSFKTGILSIENAANVPNIENGVFFEIYTPKLDVETDIYYEIGECYEIGEFVDALGNTIRIHKGSSQDQTDVLPAEGLLKGGDTYYRNRSINLEVGLYRTSIDSQLLSDFWQSRISDIGRPNIIDKNSKNVNRITAIYYSDRFMPETNINGLNSYFDTSFETYDRKYGSIQKLYSQDKRLDCFQETKVGKILIEENVIFDQFDKGTVASSEKVLSKIMYYQGEFGTLNPESFTENEGRRYFFDIRNGKVLRLSNDGLTPISDNKMHSYFESKSNFYSAFNLIPEIWGCYDENFDEYIISFGSISREEGFTPDELALVSSQAQSIVEELTGLTYTFNIGYETNDQGVPTDFEIVLDESNGTYVINSSVGDLTLDRQGLLAVPAETLAFSEKTKFWTSFYTYTPECMVRVGIDFLSFRKGQAHLHNTVNAKRNSFYGDDSSSEVWVIFNDSPSNVKVFQALSEESDTVWEAYQILTQNNQESNLILDDFSVDYGQGYTTYSKENIHYAALWKDTNTPNVSLPLLEGDSMRDVSVLVKLINGSPEEERLFAASMSYSLSERSNR